MKIDITLDKAKKSGQQIVDTFQNETARRAQCVFPEAKIRVKKGSTTGVEFDKKSARENQMLSSQKSGNKIVSTRLCPLTSSYV